MTNQLPPSPRKIEIRWALVVDFGGQDQLLGKYAYDRAAARRDPVIPTFGTRDDARYAKRFLDSYRDTARVVKVRVTVEVLR